MRLILLTLAISLGAQTVTTIVAPGTTPVFNGIPIINQFQNPYYLATDAAGVLYFTDGSSPNSTTAMQLMQIAPGGVLNLRSNTPVGNEIAIDPAGNIYLTRRSLACVTRNLAPYAGSCPLFPDPDPGLSTGDGGPALRANLASPEAIAADAKGNLFIYERGAGNLRVVNAAGTIRTVARPSLFVSAMAIGPDDNLYLIAGDGKTAQRVHRLDGNSLTSLFPIPDDIAPFHLAIDSEGNFYIPGCLGCPQQIINRFSPSGARSTVNVNNFAFQRLLNGLAFDRNGNLFIAEGPRNVLFYDTTVQPRVLRISNVGKPLPACNYSTSFTPDTLPAAGGPFSVRVSVDPSCGWSPRVTVAGVLTFVGTQPPFYTGTQTLSYNALPNTGFARTLEIQVANQRVLIPQAGDPNARPPRILPPPAQPGCTYSFNKPSLKIPASGATETIAVTVTPINSNPCIWAITPDQSWITVAGANSRQGNASITVTIAPNTGKSDRGGTLYIGAATVAIIQSAANPPADLPQISATVNAASFGAAIGRNSFATILGDNLAAAPADWSNSIRDGKFLPTELSGTRVYFNGLPAYPSYVSATQINFLATLEVQTGTVPVEVQTAAGSAFSIATYQPFAPAVFAITAANGKLYPAATFANTTTFVAPVGAIPGVASRPAKAGDNIVLYGMGLAFTNTDPLPGQIVPSPLASRDLAGHRVEIGAANSDFFSTVRTLQYVGLTFAGVYQINFQIPAQVKTGEWPLSLWYSTFKSEPANLLLALEQ